MVISYTGDAGKVSLKDMTDEQLADLKRKLTEMINPEPAAKPVASKHADPDKEVKDRMRRKIMAICHNLGWYKYDTKNSLARLIVIDGKKQLDYARINGYCLMHTAAKKPLNDLSKAELQGAILQFEKMYQNYLTKPVR